MFEKFQYGISAKRNTKTQDDLFRCGEIPLVLFILLRNVSFIGPTTTITSAHDLMFLLMLCGETNQWREYADLDAV